MTTALEVPLHRTNPPAGVEKDIAEVLSSGYIADGEVSREFEARFSEWIGAPTAVTVGDYSSGISLALHQGGVGPGDEVIAVPEACLGTNMPILMLHAQAVWADVDPATGNIDPDTVAAAITPRTKALVYAHWGGNPADVDRLNAIGRDHGLLVVEDASEALGAEHAGARIGATGSDVTVFSFGPVRHLTAGEGAALIYSDENRADQARWLKRYGVHQPTFRREDGEINPDSDIPVPGLNTYMNNIAAAIGLKGLEGLDATVGRHRENGQFYDEVFGPVEGVRPLRRLDDDISAYWVYTVRVRERDALRLALREQGIQASTLHLRNDRYSVFSSARAPLKGADEFSASRLCLPCGWWVDDATRERVADIVIAHAAAL